MAGWDFWGISAGFNGLADRIGDAFSNNVEHLNNWGRDTAKNQRQDKSRQNQPSRKFGTGGANNPQGNNEEQAANRNRQRNERMDNYSGMDNWQISPPDSNRGNGGRDKAEKEAEDLAKRQAFINEILGRLDDPFSFNSEGVNAPELEAALQAQLAELAAARGQVNDQYRESNRNLINMHNAHEKQVRGQRDDIMQQNKQYRAGIKDVFSDTVNDAEKRQNQNMRQREEMAKRLGITDAIKYQDEPTQYEEALTETIQDAESNEDVRLVDARSRGDLDLTQNRNDVNMINNMELDRRSELETVLNELLGGLTDASAEFKNQYTQDLAELRGTAEERAYQQWLEERQFDYGLLDKFDERVMDEREMDQEMQMFREKQAIEAALNQQENAAQGQDAGLNAILSNYGKSGDEIVESLLAAAQQPEARFSDPASMLRAANQAGGQANSRQLLDAILRINNQ